MYHMAATTFSISIGLCWVDLMRIYHERVICSHATRLLPMDSASHIQCAEGDH